MQVFHFRAHLVLLLLLLLLLLLQPFYGPLDFVLDCPGELVPERKIQEGKINLDILEQEIVSGSGIGWAICKCAPRPRLNGPPCKWSGVEWPPEED